MTTASESNAPAVSGFKLPLALTIALRELRSGVGGLSVFVLCIALGVAAVAAIGSIAASFGAALAGQGGPLAPQGTISASASFRARARTTAGRSALIEVKAVDGAYPLYGEVVVTKPANAGALWRSPGLVMVEPALLGRR